MNDTERMFASLAENPHFLKSMNLLPDAGDPCRNGLKQRGFKFEIHNEMTGNISVQTFDALVHDIGLAVNGAIENCLEDGAFLLGVHLDVVQPSASDEKPHVALIVTRKDRIP